ncbi:MAG: DUF2007 domain-containing protein [Armatimonadota bacterium]|nr:DUF2007 domain-containing protein [Armatimonadota bacterium]MDR7550296.1 DUF2007 domain-containing protein [Armatimonadota bacterium]
MLLPSPGDLVAVFEATSEFEAIAIRDVLTAAGIRVMVRSRRVAGYEVPTMLGGQAGIVADLLVRPDQASDARAVIAEYLASLVAPQSPGAASSGSGETSSP